MNLNQKIGDWTIIEIINKISKAGNTKTYYRLQCKCGSVRKAKSCDIKRMSDPSFRDLQTCCRRCRENQYWNNQPEVLLYSTLYHDYKNQAKRRNKYFDLGIDSALKLFKSTCYYCGETPINEWKHKTNSNIILKYQGIDRKDSKQGYTTDNVVACCSKCNYAKREQSESEFIN